MPRRQLDEDDHDSDQNSQSTPKRARLDNSGETITNVLSSALNDSGYSSPTVVDYPAVPGSIKRIRAKNFMCHGNMDVSLDKNVTFITGRNGSGKSAILAAVVLALGGRPSMLARGNTVGSYVRTGNASGTITVIFNNAGHGAYKPDVFGDEIIFERTLYATGPKASAYKIKNGRGHVISDRADAIPPILRHFDVQLTNPVMILTQDTSRTFLTQAEPKKLYEMYYSGTQLKKMDEDFAIVKRTQLMTNSIVDRYKQMIDQLREGISSLDDRIKAHEQAQNQRDRLAMLSWELIWARVRDSEKKVAEVETELQSLQERERAARQQLDVAKEKQAEAETGFNTEREQLDGLRAAADSLRREMIELQRQVENAQNEKVSHKVVIQKVERDINSITRDNDGLRHAIEIAQEQQMNESHLQRRHEKEEELRCNNEQQPIIQAELTNYDNEHNRLGNAMKAIMSEKDSQQSNVYRVDGQLNTLRSRYKDLERSKVDALARFGHQAPHLANLIDNAVGLRHFHRRPRGPIGSSMSLKPDAEKWAVAVEGCLGPLITSYICHDFDDFRVLERLMDKAGYNAAMRPTIYVRNYGNEESTYDVSANECRSEKYPNILSVLNFTDAVVRNLVIDQRGIEAVVLFDRSDEMREVTRNQRLPKSTSAYDVEGGNARPRPFRYYPPPQGHQTARYFVKSVEDGLQRLRAQMDEMEREKRGYQEQVSSAQKSIREHQMEIDRLTAARVNTRQKLLAIQQKSRRLDQEIKDLTPADTNTQALEDEIAENDVKLAAKNETLEKAKEKHNESGAKLRQLQDQLDEKKAAERTTTARFTGLQTTIDQLVMDKARRQRDVQIKLRALDDAKQHAQAATERAEREKAEKEVLLAQATELAPDRIETDRESTRIELEMKGLDASIKCFERQ